MYERDASFRRGLTDAAIISIKRFELVNADTDYAGGLARPDAEKISITGYRATEYLVGRELPDPSDFVVEHKVKTVVEELPPQLRPVLDAEVVELYDTSEPEPLTETRTTLYHVFKRDDGIGLERDIRYKLRDGKHTLHKAKESNPGKALRVTVPSEGQKIIPTLYRPEPIEDIGDRMFVDLDFCDLTTQEIDAMEANWLEVEIAQQVACVNALVNSLISGRVLRLPS